MQSPLQVLTRRTYESVSIYLIGRTLLTALTLCLGLLAPAQAASPDLAPLSLQLVSGTSVTNNKPAPTVTVIFMIGNQGTGPATANYYDQIWFSTNGVFDAHSVSLATPYHNQGVAAGATYSVTNQVSLPMDGSGNFWLFIQADCYNYLAESNENNNLSAPLAGTFTLQPPDLTPVALSLPAGTAVTNNKPNPLVTVIFTVTNQGTGPTALNYYDQIWFSTNGALDAQSVSLSTPYHNQNAPPGTSYNVTNQVTIPMAGSGNFWLFVQADCYNFVFESNKVNDASAPLAGTFTLQPPDLTPIALVLPGGTAIAATNPNPKVTVTIGIINQGTGPTVANYYDQIWFSTNGVVDSYSVSLATTYHNQNVTPGTSYSVTNQVTLPMVGSGNFWLFVQADCYNFVFESNKVNNLSASLPGTFTLGLVTRPKLQIELNINGQLELSWPTNFSGFHIQSLSALGNSSQWIDRSNVPVIIGQQYQLPDSPTNSLQFYRLAR